MIKTIAQIADIHIRKTPTRNEEYEFVFNNLLKSLQQTKPDRIVIVGDLVHDYLDLQGEQLIMAHELLNSLSEIAPVRITRGNHDCFTGDHEILTKRGWITLEEYINNNLNTEVLTFNTDNNTLEFQTPIENVKKNFNGNLKHIVTSKCDFFVTPTHEVLLKRGNSNTFTKKYAKDLILNSDLRIPLKSSENINEFDNWFELLGFCLADATFVIKNKITMNGRVQFHFKKKRKIEYLHDLLNKLNIAHNIRIGDKEKNTKVICIYSEPARKIMKFFNYNKKLSYENLLNCDKFKLKSFIDGYLNGDGSNCDYERYSCTSIFEKNAEILTTISNYVGYEAHVLKNTTWGKFINSKEQYTFYINKSNVLKSSKIINIEEYSYDGDVYCLTVPNENLFIRKNGKSFITGNCRKKSLKRVDSVKAIVKTLDNSKVIYYDKTGFEIDENIAWAVWHHGDPKNNPWKTKEGKQVTANKTCGNMTTIDLFHDPVNGCKSTTNFEMKSKTYYKLSDFKGDYSFFGDIHKMQYLDKTETKAYCGSLIAQDVTEGDQLFHGYLLWDIVNKSVQEVPIENEHSFKNIRITQYTDFNDLDFEILNPTKYMKVRFVWGTLPQTRIKENERKLAEYTNNKYKGTIISHKNEFLESEKIDINENITLQNITDKNVQHEIFREYLTKIGTNSQLIEDIITLDEEIFTLIDTTEDQSVEWNIIKFGGKNFMSYGELEIDWRNMDGLFQITGENTAGKTTIMKLISYILFGKTLETEIRMKYGDQRFVNNRNGASFCEGYLVIEANGEFFGIKKKTEITKTKSGEINGAPTTLSYYTLTNPDEEMNENTSLEKLDEDRRKLTQKKIESIIGTYDNFMRIVMTTSDTLNRILSNDMAVFIDSLLFDSGLDIFDKKLNGYKTYEKKVNEKPRVSCNVETTELQNVTLGEEIMVLQTIVSTIEGIQLPDVREKITKGRKYVEDLNKKLYTIDPEIYGLDVDSTKETIGRHNAEITKLNARKTVIKQSIVPLKETYDAERLKTLIEKKDTHKTNEYNKKVLIKAIEQNKMAEDHAIEIINGDIFRAKAQGKDYKDQIIELKNSKICSQCGQTLTADHQTHINEKIESIKKLMFAVAGNITKWETVDKKVHQDKIAEEDKRIAAINEEIRVTSLEMEEILEEIGTLTNEKNDVEKRKELQTELDQIPTKIQNEELHITLLQQKIDNHENSLKQIVENQKIEKGIAAAKLRLTELENTESEWKETLLIKKSSIGEKQIRIQNNKLLVAAFKVQEYQDSVMSLYKKCVHRDGIPRQMLANYILPKINVTLQNILSVAPFKVWLDQDDLRPKLAYNNRPIAIIDCISASGKERTFASVVLKFALNQINVKAKPTIFLLDEVMGKLLNNSVEEFIEILQLIKAGMRKVLVIEPKEEINPDYLISVQTDEDGISTIVLE